MLSRAFDMPISDTISQFYFYAWHFWPYFCLKEDTMKTLFNGAQNVAQCKIADLTGVQASCFATNWPI